MSKEVQKGKADEINLTDVNTINLDQTKINQEDVSKEGKNRNE